jgi:uncharacterized protein (TIGR03437 family)
MGRTIVWILVLGTHSAFSQGAGIWERRAPYPVTSTEVSVPQSIGWYTSFADSRRKAPGLPGVYQVNAVIPQDVPTGDRVPVTIQVNEQGLRSNTVTIAIE